MEGRREARGDRARAVRARVHVQELRRVLDDDDVWRRVFERRFEIRFMNEHERRRGREATADEPDSDERVSGLVSSSPVAGSIPCGTDSSRGVAFAPSADDPHPERWSCRVYPRADALASPFYLELPLRPVLGHRDGAHGTRRGDGANAWGIPWLHVRHGPIAVDQDAFCVHRERVRGLYSVVARREVWATGGIRRTMRSLEALARRRLTKAKPTNACVDGAKSSGHRPSGAVPEKRPREARRGAGRMGAREADAAVPRAVGGAAAVQGGVGCRRGKAGRPRTRDGRDIEPALALASSTIPYTIYFSSSRRFGNNSLRAPADARAEDEGRVARPRARGVRGGPLPGPVRGARAGRRSQWRRVDLPETSRPGAPHLHERRVPGRVRACRRGAAERVGGRGVAGRARVRGGGRVRRRRRRRVASGPVVSPLILRQGAGVATAHAAHRRGRGDVGSGGDVPSRT